MHDKVKKKLFHLYSGELTAAAIFLLVWLFFLQGYAWANITIYTGYAFALLEFILLQGTYYWYLKYNQAKQKDLGFLPYSKLKVFSMCKSINLLLIVLGLPLLIVEIMLSSTTIYFYIFLYLFAIAEYINYYHIRLSYQTSEEINDWLQHKKLRSSRLSRELKSLKKQV